MIVRIGKSGGSFAGAGKYYLHDKLSTEQCEAASGGERVSMLGQSDERVWFTDTRNTLSTDPERALQEMWRTAEDQAFLKMQAGISRAGRKCDDPVKTISLSWHKEDRPDPQHMVEQADSFLKHLGWDNHQAVYVGHNDTEHRHIHIILNRVDHQTGRTLDDYKERIRAQSWALAYEKEQENVRCEERELRAAKREHRASELNDGKVVEVDTVHDRLPLDPVLTPANDHLPHNVVMLSRPLEKAFAADEQARAALDNQERLDLKAHQRAEREAFFKDGSKLFKATRHAAYDEVRNEFRAEWRQFYKDARLAGIAGEFAKDNAIKAAIDLACSGRFEEARERFGTRDDVRSELAVEFADRKAGIEERQKEAIADRQRDACDALRLVRDVQYQELLQRQRNERAAWMAGTPLEALGLGVAPNDPNYATREVTPPAANQNRSLEAHDTPPVAAHSPPALESPQEHVQRGNEALLGDRIAPAVNAIVNETGAHMALPPAHTPEHAPVTHQLTDLAAGSIGSAASYIADQLGELFAPTPPEVREAQAAADAKRHDERRAEQPSLEEKSSAYARIIDAAVKSIEADRARGREEEFWKERDRGKDWERDR